MTSGDGEPSSELTPADVIKLAQQNHLHPHLLSPSSHQNLVSHLETLSDPSLASQYTISLLTLISLSPNSRGFPSLLASLLAAYTRLFLSSRVPPDHSSQKIIHLFTTLLGFVPVSEVYLVTESVIDRLGCFVSFEDTQILDLVPGCLGVVFREDGRERVGLVLDKLIESEWSKSVLVKMVSLVREFMGFLDKDGRRGFLEKVFKGMGEVLDLQDLPSVAYQLLVLASKGFDKKGVVEGIVRFFGSDDGDLGWGKMKRVGSIFKQVEGTVLLHVNFAVKQDPALAQEVLELVRLDLRAFNHFAFVVLLSVARVNRFRENALNVLKNALVSAYEDYKFAKHCDWLQDEAKNEFHRKVQAAEKAVLRAVNESKYGREHILPTLVQFSFLLLESSHDKEIIELCSSDGFLGIEELSIQILKTLFEIHDMSRNEIIDQCKFRILSLKSEQSLQVIRLLGYLIQMHPYPMLEHVSRLKELLDYFTFMDGKVASHLFDSLLPLTRVSRDFRDYAILVVRKAMFRREDSIRLAATSSIVNLILAEKQSKRENNFSFQDSSSQASSSQQSQVPCVTGKGLFQELSGLLQRCLYQQATFKEIIYQGLLKLALVDPASAGAVLDFLLPHFLGLFKEENVDIVTGLTGCIKVEGRDVVISEPLDCLLSCISWILLVQSHSGNDRPDSSWTCFGFALSQENEAARNQSGESFSKVFLRIRQSLKKGSWEDILNRIEDTCSTSLVEERRKCCRVILGGVIEVILNTVVVELEQAKELNVLEKEVLDFANIHQSLCTEICPKQSSGGKRGHLRSTALDNPKKLDSGTTKLTHDWIPFLATSSLCKLMQIALNLYNSKETKNSMSSQNHSQSSSERTVKSHGLVSFVLNSSLRHIKSYSTWRKEDSLKALIFGELKLIGPPLLKLIMSLKVGSKVATDGKKGTKGKKDFDGKRDHLYLSLLCMKELVTTTLLSSQFDDMLKILLPACTPELPQMNEGDAAAIDDEHASPKQSFIVKFLKPMLLELLTLLSFPEIEVLSDMIALVGERLPCEWRKDHGVWATDLCRTHTIKDAKIVTTLVSLSFTLNSPPDDLVQVESMARELQKFAAPQNDQTPEASQLFPIINQPSSSAVISCILKYIEGVIADIDRAVKKQRTFSLVAQKTSQPSVEDEHVSALTCENKRDSRAEGLVKALSPFFSMILKDTQAEQLLRLVTKFYKDLAQMAKLRIAPKGCKQLLPSLTFQNLVDLTCTQLTAPLYDFIVEVQKEQQGSGTNKGILNKIKRENRCIPDLIFHIEDYEKYLIQLSKVTKVNLLRHAKRSTARDFKILEVGMNNGEPSNDPQGGPQNGSHEDPRAEEGNESDKNSPHESAASPLVAEESESDTEDPPNTKRVKIDRIVQDSDEDEA